MSTAPMQRGSQLALITDAKGQRLRNSEEAAEYLGVHVGHIRKLVERWRTGEKGLKPIKKGRDLLFSQEELDNYKNTKLPLGRPIQPTRSKAVAERRRKMREYMREYRAQKAAKKKGKKGKGRRVSSKVIKFKAPGRR